MTLTADDLIAMRDYLGVARDSLRELADRVDTERRHCCATKLREHATKAHNLCAKLAKLKPQ